MKRKVNRGRGACPPPGWNAVLLVVESRGGEKEKEKEAYRRLPTTLVQRRGIVKDQRGAAGVGVVFGQ
jgi:hypothetical protein